MSEVDLLKIARLAAAAKAQSKYDHPDRVMLPDHILQELGFPNAFNQQSAERLARSFPHESAPQSPQDEDSGPVEVKPDFDHIESITKDVPVASAEEIEGMRRIMFPNGSDSPEQPK